SPYIRDGD
ncbi:fdhD/NarQ family protein, partial [Vibrio parahaemolyticus VPTS-2010_2]